MTYAGLYSQKDFDRIRQGRFTANNLNNCFNIDKYFSRYAAAMDLGRTGLANELKRKAEDKFGEEAWEDICYVHGVTV